MKAVSRGGLPRAIAVAVALGAVAALLPSPAFAANKLFKCVIDKRTVYQQQACPAGAEPEGAKASAPASQPAQAAASKPAPLRPVSRAASSEPAKPR